MDLILDMHHHGHPSYLSIDEETVRRRAADLPDKGIPAEVWKVVQEAASTHEKLQPQKAATPCDGMERFDAAGKTFAAQRARAIVAEGESWEEANAGELAALREMQENLLTEAQKEANAAILALEVRTGNKFLDQFQPEYFAVAFPFCFKYGTACPDVVNTATVRGQGLPQSHQIIMSMERTGSKCHFHPFPILTPTLPPTINLGQAASCKEKRKEQQNRQDASPGARPATRRLPPLVSESGPQPWRGGSKHNFDAIGPLASRSGTICFAPLST